MAVFCELLPPGKNYHIFFFHVNITRDEEWVKSLKHSLHEIGFLSGSCTEDFNPEISIFQNIHRQMEKSVILAFVISKFSERSNIFMHNLEIAVIDIINHKRQCLPVLLDNCTLPKCLQNYIGLEIGEERCLWWSKLVHVLQQDISSSSGESDEELEELCDNVMSLLSKKSLKKQKYFRSLCRKRGVAQFMSQTGTRNMHKTLLKGCGVEIINNNLILKWDRFDNILRESSDTLVNITRFNQDMDISEITFILTTEAQEIMSQGCPRYKTMVVKFLENSLLYDFTNTDYDRMTYNVRFEGHANYSLLKSVNNIARHLYLDIYKNKSSNFETVEKRLETFHDWPYDSGVDAIKSLAMMGYIYSGYCDTVTCYACNQSLYGVGKEINKTPEFFAMEHACWNCDCPYLTLLHKDAIDVSYNDRNPYVIENEVSLSERVQINDSQLSLYSNQTVGFGALVLAEAGFYIFTSNVIDFGVICGDCHYMTYTSTFNDIKELEEKHMMWSGDECPYLVKRKGLSCIKQFRKDRDLSAQYRSSLTFKAIKIKRDH